MNRLQFRETLHALDLQERPGEVDFRQRMLELLDTEPECFTRSCFPAHFTGSALVVSADGGRALLHHHRKLDRWLQFGGHCDGEADCAAVARREALEESGIEGLILASARPFDLDIHGIPAHGREPAHEHFDVRYMLIAPEQAAFTVSAESKAMRWFTPEEALTLDLDAGLVRLLLKWRRLLERRGVHSR